MAIALSKNKFIEKHFTPTQLVFIHDRKHTGIRVNTKQQTLGAKTTFLAAEYLSEAPRRTAFLAYPQISRCLTFPFSTAG